MEERQEEQPNDEPLPEDVEEALRAVEVTSLASSARRNSLRARRSRALEKFMVGSPAMMS